MPRDRRFIDVDRRYSADEMDRIRLGFVPETREDRWFIYWDEGDLFMHRAWTGVCVYVARFEPGDDGWRMVRIAVNQDPGECNPADDDFEAALAQFLIDVLLLGKPTEGGPGSVLDPRDEALWLWRIVGRAMRGEGPAGWA